MLDKYNSLAKNFCYARDRYQQKNYTTIKLKLISKRTTDGRTYNLSSASEMVALIVGDVEQLSKDRDIVIESQSRKLQRIDIFHPSYLALQYPLLFPYGKDKKMGESPLILRSKRLFQQFLVDAYTMVESERLKLFGCKQPQLRVDKYKCLHESLINRDVNAARLGKRIILLSIFTDKPRYVGYPNYFITMTCNLEWDEIKREVTSIGLKAEDRLDILCRVFKIKFDGLIDDLKEKKIFGKILGYICTVEFQRRELPHAHILLFMSNEFKSQTPDDIDKHITAEILDEDERQNLNGAFQNYMVHGPCGPYNKNSHCMKNGSCSKFYPKEFRQQTLIDEAGFSKYRRTDNGRTMKKRERVLDNKFIVLYNPKLLLKFGCHINVEYTCQTSSIKYLFKYLHKGNDRVTVTLYNAVWRLFGYEIQEKEPFVIRLPFHLEDEQLMVYGETSNVNDIVERAISHKSIFLGWMAVSMSYPYARNLTYAEFPTKFVWKDDSSKWFSRKKGFAIGRLTHVPAELTMSDDEIKQLCLVDIDKILHFYGKTLKDYPPMPLATEVDSSLLTKMVIREELNFNKDDLKKNASDVLAIATPEQRYAFDKIVTVVYCDEGGFFFVYGHGDTKKTFLWNLMSAEICSRGDIVLNVTSSGIASLLLPNGRTAHSRFKILLNITEDFVCNIKPGSPQVMLLLKAKFIIWNEAPMVSRYCYETLDKCLGDIMTCSPTYSKDLSFGGKVIVLSGDFRQILPVIPRESRQDIIHSTVNSSYLWKFCQVLKLTKNMKLSVGTTASDQDETEQFGEWLLKVGDGLIGGNMDGESEICLPADIVIPSLDQAFDELVHFSYPNILENMSSKDFFKVRTILASTLDIVEEINNHLMAIIPGGKKLYLSSDSIRMDEGNMENQLDLYGSELLNSINCSGLPPHKLILKVGVPVMLLRNIDQSSGLYNGTRLQVRKLGNYVIECEVLTGNSVGHIALVSRMNMVPTNETVPVRFQRRQFP
ncbi:uncharacterized protein LOC130974571 [Arachis stenosperma]|uniref:uncharacterized protein LOC130974571 n=1 Tax=Arachis stenosperma TaxID=217475 RepID=UPI0025AD16D3|nr:uncharacterized protein LOC130974571 [Arachis stenosperma]